MNLWWQGRVVINPFYVISSFQLNFPLTLNVYNATLLLMLTTTTKQNRQNNNPLKGKHFWGLRKIVEKANNRNISKFWNQFFSGTKLFFAGKDTLMTRISPHFHQTAESSKAEICWTQVIGFVLEVIRLARRNLL